MKTYSLKGLASKLQATIKGDSDYIVKQLRDVEWLSTNNPVQSDALYLVGTSKTLKQHPLVTQANAVLTIEELADHFENAIMVKADQFRLALVEILKCFKPSMSPPSPDAGLIDASATIGSDTKLYPGAIVMAGAAVGTGCTIMPGAVIEPEAVIGNHTTIGANAVVGHRCRIGNHCIIHGNATIGADGFGFHDQQGQRYKLEQIGNVEIGDHVEIGANTTIDRAAIETTRVGHHTKIDNQVQIGHNCQIGAYVIIVACSGIGGSTAIGDRVVIGGMATLSDHLVIPAGTVMGMCTQVMQSPKKPGFLLGSPAREHKETHRINAALKRLPSLIKEVQQHNQPQ